MIIFQVKHVTDFHSAAKPLIIKVQRLKEVKAIQYKPTKCTFP